MDWVLRSPQIHSTFSNLGYVHGDGYHINENCNAALETILHNILTEDKYLRTYRRSISFGQNINKDLIPLLIHTKDDQTIELLIRILVNLTIPIECLLSVYLTAKSDFGRHTIFEINNLLASTKVAFTDQRTTKVIIDFLKKNVFEVKSELKASQCTNICNGLLLLRNILHIPEETVTNHSPNYTGSAHIVQNQILWNMFSHSIDKVLIKLMTIPDASKWSVTMVQLIALLYKDQHAVTLHKLLNLWLDATLSESSEDNESNTTPPDRGSENSSPMFTSDPTSDSSDTGASGKSNDETNTGNKCWDASSEVNNINDHISQQSQSPNESDNEEEKNNFTQNTNNDRKKTDNEKPTSGNSDIHSKIIDRCENSNKNNYHEKKTMISENSDCGYGTQIENQESISTSSNDDELPAKQTRHQKPHNPKPRNNNKTRSSTNAQERKRKKIVKRGKSNIINVQGLSHKTPTDDDISNVLKEFTVDFLLKGYNSLVKTLHNQILTNLQLEIDTSHFFWLITYFLKFATQIELDLDNVSSILSYDIVSYLTAEGVNYCEQFELAIKLDGNNLKPNIRRLHLVVTAIREIVQAIEVYKKFPHLCKDDQKALVQLQVKLCETKELCNLMVLLLRHFNPKYHSKQYLQDLIVTNHILLVFLDNTIKLPEYTGSDKMSDHILQFATNEIMHQYGSLLEDYSENGEFVNDCVFTIMHHVGGELDCLITLFQPKILKTFTSIWQSEYEICEDWYDLIEYVINTFVKKPQSLQSWKNFPLQTENFEDDKDAAKLVDPQPSKPGGTDEVKKVPARGQTSSSKDVWTDYESSSLSWKYMQCNSQSDTIGEIVKLYKEEGVVKARDSVMKALLTQNIIDKDEYEKLLQRNSDKIPKTMQVSKEMRDNEIKKMCEQLAKDGKTEFLDWVQKVLLETCFAKIYLEKNLSKSDKNQKSDKIETKFKSRQTNLEAVSPVSYHSLLFHQSVPLVPWNCKQAAFCKDLKLLQLLHKLGFHMPVDSGKVFIRIPNFWTADFLYDIAAKILEIDTSKLKFPLKDIFNNSMKTKFRCSPVLIDPTKDIVMSKGPENDYQIHKQTHLAFMVNYTPTPGSSLNSEIEDAEKQNWLDVVQKSQDYKLTLNLGSRAMDQDEDAQFGIGMQHISQKGIHVPEPLIDGPSPHFHINTSFTEASTSFAGNSSAFLGPANPFTTSTHAFPVPDLIMPPIMSVNQQVSEYNVQVAESDACETASVASDLTRMYVSDEDEKPEVLVRPGIHESPLVDEFSLADSDSATAAKRPRIQYF